MGVTPNARWDNSGTVIPGGDAEYVVAEQPIAEYDNWFNYNIVADIQAVIDDVINKFNANTILKADTDNTPAALVVAEQTIVGRKTGNSIAALTDAEVLAIIGVAAGATKYPDTGEQAFLDADHSKLDGIELLADVTDTTNVAAAGAVMDADFSATEGMMRKTGAGTYTVIKSNLGAAVAPAVGDDSASGYGVGSQWVDTTADKVYICVDASVGVAVWKETSYIDHFLEHQEGGADEMGYYDLEYAATMHSNDTSRTVTATSYTKKKEIDIDVCADTMKFYWTTYIHNDTYSSNALYSRIYVNGVAEGVAKSNSVASGVNATVNYTEDISGLVDGDLVQIYAYRTINDLGNPGAITCTISNFRVKGKNFTFPIPVSGFTNQDP